MYSNNPLQTHSNVQPQGQRVVNSNVKHSTPNVLGSRVGNPSNVNYGHAQSQVVKHTPTVNRGNEGSRVLYSNLQNPNQNYK